MHDCFKIIFDFLSLEGSKSVRHVCLKLKRRKYIVYFELDSAFYERVIFKLSCTLSNFKIYRPNFFLIFDKNKQTCRIVLIIDPINSYLKLRFLFNFY